MPFCPACGKSVGSLQKFCRNCGASLIEESPAASPAPPGVVFAAGALVCRACAKPIRSDERICSTCLARVPDIPAAAPAANPVRPPLAAVPGVSSLCLLRQPGLRVCQVLRHVRYSSCIGKNPGICPGPCNSGSASCREVLRELRCCALRHGKVLRQLRYCGQQQTPVADELPSSLLSQRSLR